MSPFHVAWKFSTRSKFETAMDGAYAWLNNIIGVGRGAVRILDGGAFGVRYEIFHIL